MGCGASAHNAKSEDETPSWKQDDDPLAYRKKNKDITVDYAIDKYPKYHTGHDIVSLNDRTMVKQFFSETCYGDSKDLTTLCKRGNFTQNLELLATMPDIDKRLFVHDSLWDYYKVLQTTGKKPRTVDRNPELVEDLRHEIEDFSRTQWRNYIRRHARHMEHKKQAQEDENRPS